MHPEHARALLETPPVGVLMLLIPLLWCLLLDRMSARESRRQEEEIREGLRIELMHARTSETRRISAEILARIQAPLHQIRNREAIDEALRTELIHAEATIRDLIRAPSLQHPILTRCIARVRARGVEVVLLGEHDSPGSGIGTISAALADAVGTRITGLPSGARVHVSTVFRTPSIALVLTIAEPGGISSRLEFDRTGRLLHLS